MSSKARRTVLLPEPESPVRITSWLESLLAERFTVGWRSALDTALMRGGDAHIFTVFCYGTTCDMDTRFVELCRNLLVGQRLGGVLFFDHLLNQPFQGQQRHPAAFGAVDRFAEEGT